MLGPAVCDGLGSEILPHPLMPRSTVRLRWSVQCHVRYGGEQDCQSTSGCIGPGASAVQGETGTSLPGSAEIDRANAQGDDAARSQHGPVSKHLVTFGNSERRLTAWRDVPLRCTGTSAPRPLCGYSLRLVAKVKSVTVGACARRGPAPTPNLIGEVASRCSSSASLDGAIVIH